MKYLGIDFGTKRIGIAISDDDGEFAFPKEIVSFDDQALEKVLSLVKQEGAAGIVFGESGNTVDAQAKKFAMKLSEMTSVPIVFQQEDFSSVEAHRYQTGAGERDDSAAAIILQRFLDRQKK